MSVIAAQDFNFFNNDIKNNKPLKDSNISGIALQKMFDGMQYRLENASFVVYQNNKKHAPIKTHLETSLKTLHQIYPQTSSAFQSVNNSRRITLKNIENALNETGEEEANGPFSTASNGTKLTLGLTNLARIFWVFVRFDLNELITTFKKLCACMAIVDEAYLMHFLDSFNNTLWFLSVALFALRLTIELGIAFKHIFSPQDEIEKSMSMAQRAASEFHKRWSDCLNYITWGLVNAMTNYPGAFGIPLWACFPIVAGVLLFDVWLAYQKHIEVKLKRGAALGLINRDKTDVLAKLSKQINPQYHPDLNSSELSKIQALLNLGFDNKTNELIQKLAIYQQEENVINHKAALENHIFHWRQKSALAVLGAFSLSVLINLAPLGTSFFALAPLVIGVSVAVVAWHALTEVKEKQKSFNLSEYVRSHKTGLGLTAAFSLSILASVAFFPPATTLLCYFAVSGGIMGYYKEDTLTQTDSFATYKNLRRLQNEAKDKGNIDDSEKFKALADRTMFRICVDMAAFAILPPVLIGSLAICWPLTLATGVLILGYSAYLFYRKNNCDMESEKANRIIENRYPLFRPQPVDTDNGKIDEVDLANQQKAYTS